MAANTHMSELTTAATIIGGALTVAKPIVETGCKLVESLLGEPCKVAGSMLADQVYAWQWTNRINIAHRAQQIMDKTGSLPRFCPLAFLYRSSINLATLMIHS